MYVQLFYHRINILFKHSKENGQSPWRPKLLRAVIFIPVANLFQKVTGWNLLLFLTYCHLLKSFSVMFQTCSLEISKELHLLFLVSFTLLFLKICFKHLLSQCFVFIDPPPPKKKSTLVQTWIVENCLHMQKIWKDQHDFATVSKSNKLGNENSQFIKAVIFPLYWYLFNYLISISI